MVAHPDSKGFTLIEFVVMMALLAAVIGGIYEFVVWGAQSSSTTNNFVQTQGQVRAAMDNIVDETRWAQNVTAASPTSVTLLVPIATPFSAVAPYNVVFNYDAANHVVTRQQLSPAPCPCPASPLAYLVVARGGGAGLSFDYFDDADNDLGSSPTSGQLATIVRVRAVIATTSGNVTRSLAGDATLRAHP